MPARSSILFLSHFLPYPPSSGVASRTFNILKQLQQEFDVMLLPYFRRNHQPDATSVRAAREALEACGVRVGVPVPIRADHTIARRLWDHVRSLLTRRAYTYYEFASRAYREQLQRALTDTPPALIHLDCPSLYRWLPELPSVPQACTHHNIESDVLRLRGVRTKSRIVGRYIRHQAALVQSVERQCAPLFRLNVMTSALDAERLRGLAPGARTLVVPNGVDTRFFTPSSRPAAPGRVVFLGGTYLFPNRDGVDYLLQDMWSDIRADCPSAAFQLIGQTPTEDRTRYERVPAVTCLGLVPDIRPHMAEASCCVVPLRVGGGTRLKIVESWAMGKAVVSTALGCEGLEAVDGENILIRDDPKAFARAVASVLSDPRLRGKLERNGRQTAEQRYSWDTIGQPLRAAYRELIAARPRGPEQPRRPVGVAAVRPLR
jgi:glycosyltransferase involved in cell wall biosynthesis